MRLLKNLSLTALAMACTLGTAFAGPKGGAAPKGGKGGEVEIEMGGEGGPSSKNLERAIKLYNEKHDYFDASIELKKVLDEPGEAPINKQRAEFFMGKTLYQLGFYAGALVYFEKIVKQGDQHAFHAPTLKWL